MTKYIIWDKQLNQQKDFGYEPFDTAENATNAFVEYWSEIIFDDVINSLEQLHPELTLEQLINKADNDIKNMTAEEMFDFYEFEVREA